MTLLNQTRQAWSRRPAGERSRVLLGLGIGLALSGYLLVQRLELPDWPLFASSSVPPDMHPFDALPAIAAMDEATWRQGALRHGIVLEKIRADDDGWRLAGRLDTATAFDAFSAWTARQGWWALDWRLGRDEGAGLTFEARFGAHLERLSPLTREEAP